ncbi:MAG: phage head-tail connector protein, partial [Clostridium sp.]
MVQLEKLKIRLGIKDNAQDELLLMIIEDAESALLDYCNRKIILPKMDGLQRMLAICYYNRIGSE